MSVELENIVDSRSSPTLRPPPPVERSDPTVGKNTWSHFAALDQRLVEAAKDVKVLSRLSWPAQVGRQFLINWNAGRRSLPDVSYPHCDYSRQRAELRAVIAASDPAHPVGRYLRRTAASYLSAAEMLDGVGTPAFTKRSIEIYGQPRDHIDFKGLSNLDAADHFILATADGADAFAMDEGGLSAEFVAVQMRDELAKFFGDRAIAVEIDPRLAAKAAAGAKRIRLRSGVSFTEQDVGQLLQHEAFVHTATMINGCEQPFLRSMGLGAPRTTLTQEGLATFAELVTHTIDLARLRRIALRTKAIQRALDGGDFFDVFEFFLNAGQSATESFQSSARIFRGGNGRNGVVFTKDVVYLQGLLAMHTFLRKAIQSNKLDFAVLLFAGRMTLGDVMDLEPYFKSGFLAKPRYMPAWVANRHCLAAYLNYSTFVNRIELAAIRLEDFREADC